MGWEFFIDLMINMQGIVFQTSALSVEGAASTDFAEIEQIFLCSKERMVNLNFSS